MNQNHTYFLSCLQKYITFFGMPQNFSSYFMCAMRWKRLKVAGLDAYACASPYYRMLSLFFCSQWFCPEMVCLKPSLPVLTCWVLFPDGWVAWNSTKSVFPITSRRGSGNRSQGLHMEILSFPLSGRWAGQTFESTISCSRARGQFQAGSSLCPLLSP